MERNKMSAIAFIAIILGAVGTGVGAFAAGVTLTGGADGDDGDDGDDGAIGQKGDDGQDGQDGQGDIVVGIMDPDYGETIWGNITIRAMVAGSENYNVKIYINGSFNASYVPFEWNSTKVGEGWWNVTVIATDIATNDVAQDTVLVEVKDPGDSGDPIKSRVRGIKTTGDQSFSSWETIDWESETYDVNSDFNLVTDRFYAPRDGFYAVYAAVHLHGFDPGPSVYVRIAISVNGLFNYGYLEYYPQYDECTIEISDTLSLNEGEYFVFRISTFDSDGCYIWGNVIFDWSYFTIAEL